MFEYIRIVRIPVYLFVLIVSVPLALAAPGSENKPNKDETVDLGDSMKAVIKIIAMQFASRPRKSSCPRMSSMFASGC